LDKAHTCSSVDCQSAIYSVIELNEDDFTTDSRNKNFCFLLYLALCNLMTIGSPKQTARGAFCQGGAFGGESLTVSSISDSMAVCNLKLSCLEYLLLSFKVI
jgi:hypothetical protein